VCCDVYCRLDPSTPYRLRYRYVYAGRSAVLTEPVRHEIRVRIELGTDARRTSSTLPRIGRRSGVVPAASVRWRQPSISRRPSNESLQLPKREI
jgi:hypothetical protein